MNLLDIRRQLPRLGMSTMNKKVVIATIGSLGDLHPFVAIGVALKERGAKVLMAVPASQVSKV